MNKRSVWTRTALAAAFVMMSTPALALDLVGSYQKALQADPSMQGAESALLAGREKAVQGNALLKPQVQLTAALTQIDDRSTTSLPAALSQLSPSDSSGNLRQMAVQMVQPLVDAKSGAERRQLHQQTGLAEIKYRGAQQDLIERVGEAYFGVLLAQETVRVVQAEKVAVDTQLERAKARFEVGRAKITDVQETQARYDNVLTKEVSAQSTLALRQARYRELTGVDGGALAGLREGFRPELPQPEGLAAWQTRGVEQNLRVRSQQAEVAIAGAEIDKYRLRGRPTLDLVASYTIKGQNGGLPQTVSPDHERTATIGLQFSVPLFAGGAIDSKLRESLAKQRQAESDLDAARRDARLQVQDAFLAVQTGVARIASLEQSVRSATSALEATTLGRDVGSRIELDVLDAQQRLFTAQLDLAQARYDYLLGRIRLSSAVGELQETDLRALNAYLAS